jgi:hypothetical protein
VTLLRFPAHHKRAPLSMRQHIAFDRQTAREVPCDVCGGHPCGFDYLYEPEPYSYRAFALCPDDPNHVMEF